MSVGKMQLIEWGREKCIFLCIQIVNWLVVRLGIRRALALAWCDKEGIDLLPNGTRPIPSGHYNFDPAMFVFFGGKDKRDAVAKAIVFEKFRGWLLFNRQRGTDWTYNSLDKWAEQIPFWHPKTVERYIREIVKSGALQTSRPEPGKPTFYTMPTKDSPLGNQISLWPEDKTPSGGTKDSPNNTETSIHNPARNKQQSNRARDSRPRKTRASFGAHMVGVVAQFFATPGKDLPEKHPAQPEPREQRDERMPAPVVQARPPLPVETLAVLRDFWPTYDTDAELRYLVSIRGADRALSLIAHTRSADGRGLTNPQGWVRVQMRAVPVAPESADTSQATASDQDYESGSVTEDETEHNEDTPVIDKPVNDVPITPHEHDWKRAYSHLEVQLDRASFDTWLRYTRFLGFEDGVYQIGAPNEYARDMLQHRLYRDVRRVLSDVTGEQVELRFEVDPFARRPRAEGELPLFRLLAEGKR